MNKDFDNWNKAKKKLENNFKEVFFKEGEIWWTSLGINIGQESCGKGASFNRPVLIYKKLSKNIFIGLPLTSLEKKGTWFVQIKIWEKRRWIILPQIRILSAKRLERRLYRLNKEKFNYIKKKLEIFLKF